MMQGIEIVDKIEELGKSFRQEIARINTPEELEKLRIKYLGRKGLLMEIFKVISSLPAEQDPKPGSLPTGLEMRRLVNGTRRKKR